MVRQPETRYATGPEGNIAYQVATASAISASGTVGVVRKAEVQS
jgi:hypothetical protein